MKVFLTGATGYIGSVIAEKLQTTGHVVVGLARTELAAERLSGQGVEPFLGNLYYPEQLTQVVRRTDGVIHTAFIDDFNDWEKSVEIDLRLIQNFIKALKGSDKPLIATSDTGVLGDTGSAIASETYPIAQNSILAGRAKLERVIQQAASNQIRSVVLRLPIYVYGREGGASFVAMQMQAACEIGAAQYIGTGSQKISTTHVDDLAELYVLALEKAPIGSLFHTAVESGITAQEIAEVVADVTQSETESICFEEAVFNWGKTLATFLSINNQSSAQKAIQQLGWQPDTKRSLLRDIRQGSYSTLRFAPSDPAKLQMLGILHQQASPFDSPESAIY